MSLYALAGGSPSRLIHLVERATASQAPEAFVDALHRAKAEAHRASDVASRRRDPSGASGSGAPALARRPAPQARIEDAPVNLGPHIDISDLT